jgi:hypothetical protein
MVLDSVRQSGTLWAFEDAKIFYCSITVMLLETYVSGVTYLGKSMILLA